jgi:tRNA modification GTPase
MFALDDTIAAIASAPGGAARGIVRVSGAGALQAVAKCFRARNSQTSIADIKAPTAVEGEVFGEMGAETVVANRCVTLPTTLYLWPTARSYTRQPMAELHTLGSPPLIEWLLQTLCSAGARLAQPGEFTLRAFLAGRIDLTQAEAVLGVVDATDRQQLDTALTQLAGGLSRPLQKLRDDLLNLLADLEAGLDFVEEDIRFVEPREVESRLSNAANQLEALTQQLGERADARRLPRVVLVGSPNVGKSSLFNALAQQDAALVSPMAGTTRDYLSVTIQCGELQVELIDTAGIGAVAASSPIDAVAQLTAAGQHRQAILKLLCLEFRGEINHFELSRGIAGDTVIVWTKIDRLAPEAKQNLEASLSQLPEQLVATSCCTSEGLDKLRSAIAAAVSAMPGESHAVAGTAARARDSVQFASAAISQARKLLLDGAGEELIAAQIRTSLEELGKVVGAVYTDDLLDRIFSRFCIGK